MNEIVMFEDFWNLYPVHVNQRRAELAWLQMDCHLKHDIIPALKRQIEVRERREAAGEWVPEWPHAHNWLKDKRWEDELEQPQARWSGKEYNAGRHQGGIDSRQVESPSDYERLMQYIRVAGKSEAYVQGYAEELRKKL